MKLMLQPEEAVLIQGPARFSLDSGTGHVFFKALRAGSIVDVPIATVFPFVAMTNTILSLEQERLHIRKTTSADIYPESWIKAMNELRQTVEHHDDNNISIMVLGGTSSGKSGFTAVLAHQFLNMGHEVYMLDLDVGQNKLLAPGCLVLSKIEPSHEPPLPRGEIQKAFFLGSNSPRGLLAPIISACTRFRDEWKRITSNHQNNAKKKILLIDTTGYVHGSEALALKKAKINVLAPNQLVLFKETMEHVVLQEIITTANSLMLEITPITVPSGLKSQDLQERRQSRESKYSILLEDMEPMTVCLEDYPILSYSMKIEDFSEYSNRLVGFMGRDGWTIGIGYLKSFDVKMRRLKLLAKPLYKQSNLKNMTATILFSYIRINDDGTEITPFSLDSSKMGKDQKEQDFKVEKTKMDHEMKR